VTAGLFEMRFCGFSDYRPLAAQVCSLQAVRSPFASPRKRFNLLLLASNSRFLFLVFSVLF
jgi:hypothetical protein